MDGEGGFGDSAGESGLGAESYGGGWAIADGSWGEVTGYTSVTESDYNSFVDSNTVVSQDGDPVAVNDITSVATSTGAIAFTSLNVAATVGVTAYTGTTNTATDVDVDLGGVLGTITQNSFPSNGAVVRGAGSLNTPVDYGDFGEDLSVEAQTIRETTTDDPVAFVTSMFQEVINEATNARASIISQVVATEIAFQSGTTNTRAVGPGIGGTSTTIDTVDTLSYSDLITSTAELVDAENPGVLAAIALGLPNPIAYGFNLETGIFVSEEAAEAYGQARIANIANIVSTAIGANITGYQISQAFVASNTNTFTTRNQDGSFQISTYGLQSLVTSLSDPVVAQTVVRAIEEAGGNINRANLSLDNLERIAEDNNIQGGNTLGGPIGESVKVDATVVGDTSGNPTKAAGNFISIGSLSNSAVALQPQSAQQESEPIAQRSQSMRQVVDSGTIPAADVGDLAVSNANLILSNTASDISLTSSVVSQGFTLTRALDTTVADANLILTNATNTTVANNLILTNATNTTVADANLILTNATNTTVANNLILTNTANTTVDSTAVTALVAQADQFIYQVLAVPVGNGIPVVTTSLPSQKFSATVTAKTADEAKTLALNEARQKAITAIGSKIAFTGSDEVSILLNKDGTYTATYTTSALAYTPPATVTTGAGNIVFTSNAVGLITVATTANTILSARVGNTDPTANVVINTANALANTSSVASKFATVVPTLDPYASLSDQTLADLNAPVDLSKLKLSAAPVANTLAIAQAAAQARIDAQTTTSSTTSSSDPLSAIVAAAATAATVASLVKGISTIANSPYATAAADIFGGGADGGVAAAASAAASLSNEAATILAATQRAQSQAAIETQRGQADNGDWRVKLRLAGDSDYLYNDPDISQDGILYPLYVTGGVVFPYTPSISTTYGANYSSYDLTHSNYRGQFYQNSYVDDINIQATFTAQDTSEANYLLAVIHFFRSVTKMFYGQDAQRGAPPPLVFLQGLGEYQFNLHPCVVKSFNYSLPSDIDYIRARTANINGTNLLQRRDRQTLPTSSALGSFLRLANATTLGLPVGALAQTPAPQTLGTSNPTYVPTKLDMTITLTPMQTRDQVSKQFSLKGFANGDLLKGGFW